MHYLLLAVTCSVIVSVILKIARRNRVELAQAVAANYVVAFGLTLIYLQPQFPEDFSTLPWGILLALGVLLPSIFIVMGRAVDAVGIAKSDVAQRLSLIIPIVVAFTLFGDKLNALKVTGVAMAFVALLFLLVKDHEATQAPSAKTGMQGVLLLLGVWLGYGVIDTLFKQLTKMSLPISLSLSVIFPVAWLLIVIYIAMLRQQWTLKSVMGGVVLGVFNFFNILFYIKAHIFFKENAILVFTGMNIGVIVIGTLTGVFIFKEKIKPINVAGLFLAVAAVLLLSYEQGLFA